MLFNPLLRDELCSSDKGRRTKPCWNRYCRRLDHGQHDAQMWLCISGLAWQEINKLGGPRTLYKSCWINPNKLGFFSHILIYYCLESSYTRTRHNANGARRTWMFFSEQPNLPYVVKKLTCRGCDWWLARLCSVACPRRRTGLQYDYGKTARALLIRRNIIFFLKLMYFLICNTFLLTSCILTIFIKK
jgi:hypothetical protein